MTPEEPVRTLVGVGVLSVLTVAVLVLAGAPHRLAPLSAIARGLLQLAAISLILADVITSPLLVGLALAVMFTAATATATGRLGWSRGHLVAVVAAVGVGVIVVVFATGAVAFSARCLPAVGGTVIGDATSTATLAGRLLESIDDQREQVEGWLALGAGRRQATRMLAQRAVGSALIPTVDQTRTTGLVTLPGAFVGAILGGVSPLEAGRFQIVALAAIAAAGSITALVVTRAVAPGRRRPEPLR